MPVTQSATKALRQDRKREQVNRPVKSRTQAAIVAARKNPTQETVRQAYSALDKAVKKQVIKKGKANRLKNRLAALLTKEKSPQSPASKKARPTPKKKTTTKTSSSGKKKA